MKTEVTEDERFRFECCAHSIGIGTERDADEDRYDDSETQCSWECWQAGRAQLLAERDALLVYANRYRNAIDFVIKVANLQKPNEGIWREVHARAKVIAVTMRLNAAPPALEK